LIAGSDGFDVKDVRASGANAVSIKLTSDDNLVRCNSVSGSPLGVRIEGKGNDVRDGTVSGITGKGVEIGPTGSNNQFRKATVRQNSGAGIVVEGTGNTLGGNRVNGNIANDTHIKAAAAGTNLKSNQSGNSENGGRVKESTPTPSTSVATGPTESRSRAHRSARRSRRLDLRIVAP